MWSANFVFGPGLAVSQKYTKVNTRACYLRVVSKEPFVDVMQNMGTLQDARKPHTQVSHTQQQYDLSPRFVYQTESLLSVTKVTRNFRLVSDDARALWPSYST
jgi:hypothetical protein